jgi:PAS domain-containing protein
LLRALLLGLAGLAGVVGLAGAGGYGVFRWFRADGSRMRLDQSSIAYLNRYPGTVAFDARGTRAMACGGHGPVVWDLPEGRMRHGGLSGRLGKIATHAEQLCAFSPDGTLMAGVINPWWPRPERPGIVHLWDASTGQVVRKLDESMEHVDALAFSPDGAELALSRNQYDDGNPRLRAGKILLYRVASGEKLEAATVERAGQAILSLAYLPDGAMVFASRKPVRRAALEVEEGELVLHDPATGRQRAVNLGREPMLKAVRPSRDGRLLLITFEDSPLVQIRDRDGRVVRELQAGAASAGFRGGGAFSADARFLIHPTDRPAGTPLFRRWTRGVGIWDIGTGELRAVLAVRSGIDDFVISDLAVSSDDRTLAVGYGDSYDGGLELWNLAEELAP